MAYAISKEMKTNVEFRKAIYAKLDPNQYRFKEIVLGQFKNKLINGISVETLLNKHLSEIMGVQRDEPVLSILLNDPLLTLWLPNDYIFSLPENVFEDEIPISTCIDNTIYMFKDGFVSTNSFPDPLHIFTMFLSEAPNYKLFDTNTKEYSDPAVKFEDMHGLPANLNILALQKIGTFPDYELVPGKKLVNPYEDVYVEFLRGDKEPIGPSPEPVVEDRDVCERAGYAMEYTSNYNRWSQWKFTNFAAYNFMNSNACENIANTNGARTMLFTYVIGNGGVIDPEVKKIQQAFYKTELLQPIYHWERVWSLFQGWHWEIWWTTHELKWVSFPAARDWVFTTTSGTWTPESNGDIIYLDVKQLYMANTCTTTITNTNAESFKINATVKFGQVVGGLTPTVEYTNTQTQQILFSATAPAVWDWGRLQFEYCQPYIFSGSQFIDHPIFGLGDLRWLQQSSTGSIDVMLFSKYSN